MPVVGTPEHKISVGKAARKAPKKTPKKRGRKKLRETVVRDALRELKKAWIENAPAYYGISPITPQSKMKEALAFVLVIGKAYLDLDSEALAYVAKLHDPRDAVILLADLRTKIGDNTKEKRASLFVAIRNVINMWESLPNDTHYYRAICVTIELLRYELDLLLQKARQSLAEDSESRIPDNYKAICDYRTKTLASLKNYYEIAGLTAKAMKDSKKDDDSAHALSKLHLSTTKSAVEMGSEGIGNLIDMMECMSGRDGGHDDNGTKAAHGNQTNSDMLSDIDEAFISEPFAEEESEDGIVEKRSA